MDDEKVKVILKEVKELIAKRVESAKVTSGTLEKTYDVISSSGDTEKLVVSSSEPVKKKRGRPKKMTPSITATPVVPRNMILSWQDIERVLATRRHVLLYGPPGTGKTKVATTVDSYSITLTAETPAAELRGHYIPEGSKFIWHDGPIIRAWREGKRVVLNEIDQASGDALTFLYAMLDDPEMARYTLPTGETVRPAEGFQAVATTNANDFLAMMPAALLDRFSIRIAAAMPHPEALKRLSKPLSNMVEATIDKEDNRKVSLRQAYTYEVLEKTFNSPDIAAKAVFGSRNKEVYNALVLAIAEQKKNGK